MGKLVFSIILGLGSLTLWGCDGCSENYVPPPYNGDCVSAHPYDPDWAPGGVTLNILDLGAVGDGTTNDTVAFQTASGELQAAGGGTLIIPAGTYIVGEQTHVEGTYPYWREANIFSVNSLNGLIIDGEPGAVIRLAPGQRYGAFDKDTGEAFETLSGGDTDYAANSGRIFVIANSTNVIIRDLEIDGSNESLIIGGSYGDVGIQLPNDGLRLFNNSNLLIQNVTTHHHGRDGIIISYTGVHPHLLENVVSEYNGRQGLSWIGGIGLTVRDSEFNHTGQAAISSPPSAGMDIEAETSEIRDGLFCDTKFMNNVGCGMVADTGDSADLRFVGCTFWATTSWGAWNDKPGVVFEDCTFHGPIVHPYGSNTPRKATTLYNCHFEDVRYDGFTGSYCSRFLVEYDNVGENILFDGCTFVANEVKPLWLTGGATGNKSMLRNCTITNKNPDIDDGWTSLFGGRWYLENVHFMEDFPAGFDKTYYINTHGVEVGPSVVVDGTHVGFTWHMYFNEIEPRVYTTD